MTEKELFTECKKISKISKDLLKLTPTKSPIDIANSLGVKIHYINNDLKGFIVKGDCVKNSTIYINEQLDNYSRKIICAHELGHLYSDSISENEASLFDSSIDSESEFLANYMVKCLMPNVFIFATSERYETIHAFNDYVESCIHYKEK